MTTRMKTSIVAIAVLLIGSSLTWASEPNDGGIVLKFEVKSRGIGPLSPRVIEIFREFGPWRPACAAGIPFAGPTGYLARPGSGQMNGFLRSVLEEVMGKAGPDTHDGLSTAQKQFLRATNGLLDSGRQSGPVPQWYPPEGGPETPRHLLLYAVTLEDAKKMAEAYVRFAMETWRADVDKREKVVRGMEQSIATDEEQASELTKLIETSGQALEPLRKKVPYRTEDEAIKAISELDRMLNAAQVDIAGIRARIGAIQEHLQTGKSPYDEAIKAKLQGMFVEESVALQGAEARKAMATQLRTDASHFLELRETIANAKKGKAELLAEASRLRPQLEVQRSRLANLMGERPEIADHVIPIYPVEWASEGQRN